MNNPFSSDPARQMFEAAVLLEQSAERAKSVPHYKEAVRLARLAALHAIAAVCNQMLELEAPVGILRNLAFPDEDDAKRDEWPFVN